MYGIINIAPIFVKYFAECVIKNENPFHADFKKIVERNSN